MLVDVEDSWCEDYATRWNAAMLEHPGVESFLWPSQSRVAPGIYRAGSWMWAIDSDPRIDDYPFEPLFMFSERDYDNFDDCVRDRFAELRRQWDLDYPFEVPNSYGMADNWEQIITRWPLIVTSHRKFFIDFHTISKAAQGEQGFRFHKNGEYIGTQRCLGYEYFRDEPHMGDVISFHLHEVTEP